MINSEIELLNESIISFRRDLHSIPETGNFLPQTTNYIISVLNKYNIPFKKNINDSGLIIFIDTHKPGKILGFRSDMDALPIKEETNLTFASQNNNMHACGHDCHMSILLNLIIYIHEHISSFSGSFLFVFQTGEETATGANIMVNEPFFIEHKPDYMFGLHVGSLHPKVTNGMIGIIPGKIMASYDKFVIHIKGIGCHGSTPEKGDNPILKAIPIIYNLQNIISSEIPAREQASLAICQIHSGSTYNIIPSECTIEGTFRTLDSEIRKYIIRRIKEISKDAEIILGAGPVDNSIPLTNMIQNIAYDVFPENDIFTSYEPIMVGEDFSVYQEEIPGCFVFLGTTKEGTSIDHHNSHFDVDETYLWKGLQLFIKIAQTFNA